MENQLWLLGIHRQVVAAAAETGGMYDLIASYIPAGVQTPPHIHQEYVETEYVLEGKLTIFTDTEQVVLQAGQGYTIPMGKPHALTASAEGAVKTITIFSPSGFAEIIKAVGVPGKLRDGPPVTFNDMALFNSLSEAIGDITLGPPGKKIKPNGPQ